MTIPASLHVAARVLPVGAVDQRGALLGLDPKELGMPRHMVKPATVIDWSTSVVGGVGAA